ncbi:MAG: hypothetical protein A3D26_00235 [Candidatus Blackburnbacteria bacterium RIFCSPHIGHO2_02_FULL_44_20]|uniref:Uncharacterized protein n=1 Tax=Candidatus Blackburnbacteria bacterium RIFCSPHIGHO2_02_FULL_44_20 TaxID=1797516 RepID=A0A1G1V590_9BACT|nr:MAG: hypothetical protein A3D26_00235 [Candidatus Blackburnbacteria bacterium RIFCSPHIGHO2_02_FULL_44_20]OGY12255.1 MAG: hypothetical protein A3E16_01920 [Candidatus Blackburnbacteria bacterium RIFCSPHIGHO2_12_FULL_44_25]
MVVYQKPIENKEKFPHTFQVKRFLLLFPLLLVFAGYALMPRQINAETSKKSKSPTFSASRPKNKLSVQASFANLSKVKSISYELTYGSAKGPQGAGGTIKVGPTNKTLSRKILLGTCSGKVCTYHKDVKNIKLSVAFKLKSGGVVSYERTIK